MCEDCARERAAREAEREKRRAADERANEEARLHTQVTGELLRERSRLAAALDALRPFVDPESYSTAEEACRLNPAMGWCAVHSFRWPCPVASASAFLAGGKP